MTVEVSGQNTDPKSIISTDGLLASLYSGAPSSQKILGDNFSEERGCLYTGYYYPEKTEDILRCRHH